MDGRADRAGGGGVLTVAGMLLDHVRTYGGMVAATIAAVRATRERLAPESGPVGAARIRVRGPSGTAIERTGPLTPYLVEAICDDARRAGPGASVSIVATAQTCDAALEQVAARLEGLARRGVGVRIARDPSPRAA